MNAKPENTRVEANVAYLNALSHHMWERTEEYHEISSGLDSYPTSSEYEAGARNRSRQFPSKSLRIHYTLSFRLCRCRITSEVEIT
jgi:hypothetical protein